MKPTKFFNEENKFSKSVENKIKKAEDLLNIQELNIEDRKNIQFIIESIPNINWFVATNQKNLYMKKINLLKKCSIKDISIEVTSLKDLVIDILKGNSENITYKKPTISMSGKKKYIINKMKSYIKEFPNESHKCQMIINRTQNSNMYINSIYSNFKNDVYTGIESINKIYNLLVNYKQNNGGSVITLAGNKANVSEKTQSIVTDKMEESNKIVVPFGGSGNDLINLIPILKKETDVVLNSIDNILYHTYTTIYNNKENLIKELSNIEIQTSQFDNISQYKKFFTKQHSILNERERNEDYGIETIAIFIYLSSRSFGGNISFEENKTTIGFSSCINKNKKSSISKIEYFHYMTNQVNITFENLDYKEIFNKYDSKDTLFVNDPLYVSYKEEELKQTQVTYGKTDFNHIQYVEDVRNLKGQFITHNYYHTKLIEITTDSREDIKYDIWNKVISNGSSKKTTKANEIIFYKSNKVIEKEDEVSTDTLNYGEMVA